MFEREIALYQFTNGYLKSIIKDFDDQRFTSPIAEGVNPPAWVVSHIAISNDFILALLGDDQRVCPQSWRDAFGPRMSPSQLRMPYPTRSELVDALDRGCELVSVTASKADPAFMDQPHSVELFRGTPVKTNGDAVALLMTAHLSTHVGQLSIMRRQGGFAPIF